MLKAFTFRLLRRNSDTAARRARLRQAIHWQLLAPAAATLRRSALAALSWWPLASPPPPRVARGEDVRVAYFHHAFPLPSETFIQREVLALRRAGLALDGTGDVTPNVVIEAMATGLAVISTRSRAIPELVEDGVSGLLVEPGDAGTLAAAIARVLDDPGLARSLGRNARARVEQRFDIHRNTRKLFALFRGELDHGENES